MKKLLLNLFFGLLAVTAFSQTPDNWTVISSAVTIEQETTTVNVGSSSAKVTWTSTSNQDIHSDEFDVVGDASYSYSLDVFDNTNAGRVRMVIAFDGTLTYFETYSVDQASWQTLNVTGTVPTGATKGYVKLRFYDEGAGWAANGNQATVYVDSASYVEGTGDNMIANGGFETWPVFANITGTKYVSATELDVIYDGSITSVDPADYDLTGTADITFTGATIDGTDDKIVHLTGASASITGDATLDNIADANVNLDFYAGIMPFEYINTTNAGGVITDGVAATFSGIVSANDNFNGVWVADAAGAYNGAYIFDYDFDAAVAVGDEIVFTAERGTYNNITQLSSPTLIETISSGNDPYGPDVIAGSQIDAATAADTDPAESWEGQLVKIANAKITSALNTTDWYYEATDDAGTTTFRIGDNVDYKLNNVTLAVDDQVSIIGVVDYEDGAYRINPRGTSDIQSPVALVTSTTYTVDDVTETIVDVNITATLSTFESNLTPAAGATFETYEADGMTIATNLMTGYKVIVTAEDEVTTKTYTITVNTAPLTDASVSSTVYAVDNTLETITNIPFSAGLPTFVSNIIPATGATFMTYEADGSTPATDLASGYKLTGTAEDATTTKTYIITLNAASTDATLSDLTIDGTTVANFSPATLTYNVELLYGTTTVPTVVAVENHPYANAVVTPAANVTGTEPERTTTIVVTAEDASTETYTIIFTVAPETGDLIISEYVEGGSSNRAIEIYNPNSESVDLSAYTVKQSYSGDGWGIRGGVPMIAYVLPLEGTLAAGEVYVIAHADASAEILAVADISFSYSEEQGARIPSFTGDDAIGLFKYDVLVDQVGFELDAEGIGPWDVAGIAGASQDHTLIRKMATTIGNTDWASSAGTTAENSEWIVMPSDYINNLGAFREISTDATLSDLMVDGTTVTAFASGTFDYAVELDAGTTAVPTVTATPNSEYAVAVVDPATNVDGTEAERTTTITVTADDDSTEEIYTIVFSVASSTGINELANGFKIYPNPNNGLFTLELNNRTNYEYTVEVYDVIGKIVYKSNITENVSSIDLSHMNAGLYYVSVNKGDVRNITKIMIQ